MEFDRFGLYLDRAALPGDRVKLRENAEVLLAPDDVLATIDRLPPATVYQDAAEVWAAIGPRV
jgi:hypothetical protein